MASIFVSCCIASGCNTPAASALPATYFVLVLRCKMGEKISSYNWAARWTFLGPFLSVLARKDMSGKPIELISGRCCCGLGPKFQLSTSLYNVFTLIPDEQCLTGHYFNTQPHLSYWHMRANAREYFLKFEETLSVNRFLDNKVHESFQFYLVTWLSFCTLKW